MIGIAQSKNIVILILLFMTIACQPEQDSGPGNLRIAVMEHGTVSWEMDTIFRHELDRHEGFRLELLPFAGGAASKIAFQGGSVDAFVTDWLWVARQRAAGKDYVFLPWSRAVGGLMVPADSPVQTIADLRGGKIGIAGGPLDKSWLILRAFASHMYGVDPASYTEQVFGAPPLIYHIALSGDLDASINYWHFGARMKAAGMRELVTVEAALRALDLDPDTPLLGFALKGELIASQPQLIAGLARASRRAKELLASSDAEWEILRPRLNANNQAQFEQLRAGFRAGIPERYIADEGSMAKMLAIMREYGGKALLGEMSSLPEGVLLRIEDLEP